MSNDRALEKFNQISKSADKKREEEDRGDQGVKSFLFQRKFDNLSFSAAK